MQVYALFELRRDHVPFYDDLMGVYATPERAREAALQHAVLHRWIGNVDRLFWRDNRGYVRRHDKDEHYRIEAYDVEE